MKKASQFRYLKTYSQRYDVCISILHSNTEWVLYQRIDTTVQVSSARRTRVNKCLHKAIKALIHAMITPLEVRRHCNVLRSLE